MSTKRGGVFESSEGVPETSSLAFSRSQKNRTRLTTAGVSLVDLVGGGYMDGCEYVGCEEGLGY